VFRSERDGDSELYEWNASGAGPVDATRDPGDDFAADWSPDGTRLVLDRVVGGNDDIYVVNRDGTGLRRLTFSTAVDENPSWSPDGRHIVFDSNRDAGFSEIYRIDADGGGLVRLTDSGADYEPSYSPDGTRIAFASGRDGNWEIYSMNADGSGQTDLTNDPADDFSAPAWAPNGSRLAFSSLRGGNRDLYAMNANGSGVTRLTTDAGVDDDPAWSPDGTQLAFSSDRAGGQPQVFLVAANGSTVTPVTSGQPGPNDEPAWAPAASVLLPPWAPNAVTAVAGQGQATVSFGVPFSNGGAGITGYTVTASPGGITASGPGSPLVVGGLTNGRSYSFTVTATNGVGTSSASAPTNVVTPLTAPGAPTGVTATSANRQATVSFTAPASDGGAAIGSYTVTASPGGLTATGAGSPIAVKGLANGQSYTFTVAATTAFGPGPPSAASNAVVPAPTVPGAPSAVTATQGLEQAVIQLVPPSSDGGSAITSYTATSSPGGFTASGPAGPLVVTGLTGGQSYTFTVTATNGAGTGPASPESNAVTPVALPGPPTNVTATPGNAQVTITFDPPASMGTSRLNEYLVWTYPDRDHFWHASGSPAVANGLENGRSYRFTVAASTGVGDGPPSEPTNAVTPRTVPGAPRAVSAVAGDGQAAVSFTPPVSNGGEAVSSYTVTASPGGRTATGASSPLTVTGLGNGTSYTFTVTAANGAGDGPSSVPSNAVTPHVAIAVPGAPTGVSAVPGDGQATVSFTPPAASGGGAIGAYTVTASPGGRTATSATSPITVGGLANGTAYTFTVTATNIAGAGPASAPTAPVTPRTVPGAPTIVSVVPGDGRAAVSFAPPVSNGGAAIASYEVVASPGGRTAAGTSSPVVVDGLANGIAYTFLVRATNIAGPGLFSAPSVVVTPRTVPGASTGVAAVAGNGQATVSFTPPASDGGAAITSYTVTASPGGQAAAGTSSPIDVTGLTNGTSYTFTVIASNAAGTGPASAPSAAVVPGRAGRTPPPEPPALAAPRPPVPDIPLHSGPRPPVPPHP